MSPIEGSELQSILDKYGITDAKDLDLQLSDSEVLYKVGSGLCSAGALMTCFVRMWPKETLDRVAQQLIEWLTATGYLQPDLWNGSVAEKDRIGKAFVDGVEKLCAEGQIPKTEWGWYSSQVGLLISGNRTVIQHISEGDLSDVERFFVQVHGRRENAMAVN